MGFFGKNRLWPSSVIIALIIINLWACDHEAFDRAVAGDFYFSTDTVFFDTIFTNRGTPTFKLLVKNPNNHILSIDSVYLANREKTDFVVNVNGNNSLPQKRIAIGANDSLYVFIQAFIPSSESNSPFISEDSLVFVSGNLIKKVRLIAFGQNALLYRDVSVQTQEWFKGKPFLIYGNLTVDVGHKLTIHEGVKVFMHRNANLLVKGTIEIRGTVDAPVKFKDDRMEKDYDTIPGQWGGLIVTGTGSRHIIRNASFRNGTTGIVFGEQASSNTVKAEITNTVIANMAYSGLIAYQAEITAQNMLVANTGGNTCSIFGGDHKFTHCTFANYGARYIARSVGSASLLLSNYLVITNQENKQLIVGKPLIRADFGNSIIFGGTYDEVKIQKKEDFPFDASFVNCLLHISNTAAVSGNSNIFNKPPLFLLPHSENFRIGSLSPAINAGNIAIGKEVPLDLENKPRNADLAPDIGAYEFKEK